MADYGLLTGLAEGLKSGVDSYRTERDYQSRREKELEDKALQKRMMALKLMEGGFQEQDGGFIKTPEQERKEATAQLISEAPLLKEGLMPKYNPETKTSSVEPIKGFKRKGDDILADEMKMARLEEMRRKAGESSRMRSPEGRLEKAGGDVKQKIGFLTSGLQALTRYSDAAKSGQSQSRITPQTPFIGGLVGSTPIDESRTAIEEAIGRLASGGAINVGEESRFRGMIPTASDYRDPATVQRKLENLRREFETKLNAYGFKPSELGELGFDSKSMGYGGKGLVQDKTVNQEAAKPPVTQNGVTYEWNPKTGKYE